MRRPRAEQFLLRFDDICPTMRWDLWAEIEACLVEHSVKPILAVVPDNRDPGLRADRPAADFWDRARRWQTLGWTIALHGYQHLYVARAAGLTNTRKKSEFASLPSAAQAEKLQRGTEIFAREGIRARTWIAPGDAFDAVTVSLLPSFGIDILSAGWFWRPLAGPHRTTWVPCQISILRPVPPGVWTVCSHHNSWTQADLREFQTGVARHRDRISTLERILREWPPVASAWSYRFCTCPRLSSLMVRAQLKFWKMWRSGSARHSGAESEPCRNPQASAPAQQLH